jgi:hypothetical protein
MQSKWARALLPTILALAACASDPTASNHDEEPGVARPTEGRIAPAPSPPLLKRPPPRATSDGTVAATLPPPATMRVTDESGHVGPWGEPRTTDWDGGIVPAPKGFVPVPGSPAPAGLSPNSVSPSASPN